MTTLRSELSRYAGHHAVKATSAVWDHLAAAVGLNIAFTICAVVPLSFAAGGSPLPAVVTGVVLIGGSWGVLLDAAAQMVAGRAHLGVSTMLVSARRTIVTLAPLGFAALALQAALHMPTAGQVAAVRFGAIVVDLLIIGTLLVLLPAAGAEIRTGAAPMTDRWRFAAAATGRRPVRTLESLAVLAVLVGIGRSFPLVALLIGPMLLAAFITSAFAANDPSNPI